MTGEDEHLEAAYEDRETVRVHASDIEDLEYTLKYDEDELLAAECDECHAPAFQPCDPNCINAEGNDD